MRTIRFRLVLASTVLLLAGCASGEQWSTWKQHPTHFASGDHMFFSVRNREGTPSNRVTRDDLSGARDQGWWGQPITVSQEQILER